MLIILAFLWSFNTYLRQETPTKDFTRINTSESTNKIKLFENYSSQTLRVAVLNGCGVSGVGNSYGNILTNRYVPFFSFSPWRCGGPSPALKGGAKGVLFPRPGNAYTRG